MVNPFKEVNWSPSRDELKTFAKSLIIGFPIVGVLMLLGFRLMDGHWDPQTPLKVGGIGAAAGVMFWLIPAIARPFYAVWYAAACCIGIVVANIVLGIVFYVFVTGLALGMKLIGRDPMRRKLDREAKTYWLDAQQPTDPKRYYSQF